MDVQYMSLTTRLFQIAYIYMKRNMNTKRNEMDTLYTLSVRVYSNNNFL